MHQQQKQKQKNNQCDLTPMSKQDSAQNKLPSSYFAIFNDVINNNCLKSRGGMFDLWKMKVVELPQIDDPEKKIKSTISQAKKKHEDKARASVLNVVN